MSASVAESASATADGRGSWELVAAAQAGDAAAFGEFYQRYRGEVSRFVGRRVSSRAKVEDLTSETFLRAWRSIGRLSNQGRDPRAWLTTIAARLVIDDVKSARTQRERLTGVYTRDDEARATASAGVPGPEQRVLDRVEEAERASEVARLREAIDRLTPAQRRCLALRDFEGLDYAQIGALMDRGPVAAKGLRDRAMVALRKELTQRPDQPPARETQTVPAPRPARPVSGSAGRSAVGPGWALTVGEAVEQAHLAVTDARRSGTQRRRARSSVPERVTDQHERATRVAGLADSVGAA